MGKYTNLLKQFGMYTNRNNLIIVLEHNEEEIITSELPLEWFREISHKHIMEMISPWIFNNEEYLSYRHISIFPVKTDDWGYLGQIDDLEVIADLKEMVEEGLGRQL